MLFRSFTLEVEATKPDGRRVFAALPSVLVYDPVNGGTPYTSDANTLALFHLDGNYGDSSSCSCLTTALHVNSGTVNFARAAWPRDPNPPNGPANMVARFSNYGDELQAALSDTTIQSAIQSGGLTIDGRIYVRAYKSGDGSHEHLFSLRQEYNSQIDLYGSAAPVLNVNNTGAVLSNSEWNAHITPNAWHNKIGRAHV